jgi:hypothetical protein
MHPVPPLDSLSCFTGVGHPAILAAPPSVVPFLLEYWPFIWLLSCAVTVGHPVQSFSLVRRAETTSRGSNRPAGVSRAFQVILYSVEPSFSVLSSNLLAKDNDRRSPADNSEKVRP